MISLVEVVRSAGQPIGQRSLGITGSSGAGRTVRLWRLSLKAASFAHSYRPARMPHKPSWRQPETWPRGANAPGVTRFRMRVEKQEAKQGVKKPFRQVWAPPESLPSELLTLS